MRLSCAAASLIYCMTTNAQDFMLVQSNTIHNLYGNAIATRLVKARPLAVFNARDFAFDRSVHSRTVLGATIKDISKDAAVKTVIYLDEPKGTTGLRELHVQLLSTSTEFNDASLRAARLTNEDWTPVYVISEQTKTAAARFAWLETNKQSPVQYKVQTIAELRSTVFALNKEPMGTLVLNAFTLLDEWNKPVGYARIERELLAANTKHVEVGVCTPGFTTAYAIGPSAVDAAQSIEAAISGKTKARIGSCVNLKRASARPDVYRSVMGSFDLVQ